MEVSFILFFSHIILVFSDIFSVRESALFNYAKGGGTKDGGSIALGMNASPHYGVISKFSKHGEREWFKKYDSGQSWDSPQSFVEIEDGYIIVGQYGSIGGLVMKLFFNGTIAWSKAFKSPTVPGMFRHVIEVDGYFLTCGRISPGGFYDAVMVNFSKEGEVFNAKQLESTSYHEESIRLASSTDRIAASLYIKRYGTVTKDDIGIIMMDKSGNVLWKYIFGTSNDGQSVRDIHFAENGDLLVSGTGVVGLMRLAPNGTVLWVRDYGNDCGMVGVYELPNNDIFGVGGCDGTSAWSMRTNNNASNIIWSKKVIASGTTYSGFTYLGKHPTGGFVAPGTCKISGTNRGFLSVFLENGESCDTSTSDTPPSLTTVYSIRREELTQSWIDISIGDGASEYNLHDITPSWTDYSSTPTIVCYGCGDKLIGDSEECSGEGDCDFGDGKIFCDCEEDYYGEYCEVTYCFGVLSNVSDSCNGNGTCNTFNGCTCNSGYLGSTCEDWGCFTGEEGYIHNDSRVCSSHGRCSDVNVCECEVGFFGVDCDVVKCYDVFSNISSVCGGHGNCSHDFFNCSCEVGYYGMNCSEFKCFHKFSYEVDVCRSHGSCIDIDKCNCSEGYLQPECTWKCFEMYMDENRVCSGHGYCLGPNNCSCFGVGLYSGKKCAYWTCFGVDVFEGSIVCGGHGTCIDLDFCLCSIGYSTNESLSYGAICNQWNCGVYRHDEEGVCNRRGKCVGADECSCFDDYEGAACETWSCGYVEHKVDQTCNGNGKCKSPENCECIIGYRGKYCDENVLYLTVMTPILAVSGVGAVSFLLFILAMFCVLVCIVFYLSSIIFAIFSFGACYLLVKQREGIRRFSLLKNFDLLLKEQELEDNNSIAHLRINKKLFEIPFEEIETEKVLGEGGSQSIVFKALWRGRTIAFKCFKTRTVCSNQESFNEFEREVGILSSLSHPHVIRFFGATLNPPRVGIVMEFCSKGELGEFIDAFRREKEVGYPMEGKFRLFQEICSAMEYLHSRNIIHRDLKCENVLIDELEHAKLMDFGLSKLVDRMSVKKTKRIGTGIYMAPEVINEGGYTEKCDVFSMAILIYIVITENPKPYGENDFQLEFKIASNPSFRPKPNILGNALKSDEKWIIDVIEKCWSHDSEKRYSFRELGEMFNGERESKRKLGLVDENGTTRDYIHDSITTSSKIDGEISKLDSMEEMRSEITRLKRELDEANKKMKRKDEEILRLKRTLK